MVCALFGYTKKQKPAFERRKNNEEKLQNESIMMYGLHHRGLSGMLICHLVVVLPLEHTIVTKLEILLRIIITAEIHIITRDNCCVASVAQLVLTNG